jgi:hypothetical protein
MQIAFYERLFSHMHEYLGKDALRVLACVSSSLDLVKQPAASHSAQSSGIPQSPAEASNKLRLTLVGEGVQQASGSGPAGVSPASGLSPAGSGVASQQPVAYLINEVNLLTLLDSFKLFLEPRGSAADCA